MTSEWKTSSHCNNGSCVGVALLPGDHIGVRDTKLQDSPILKFTGEEWLNFTDRIKRTS